MKKHELKASLDKIRPREELIESTLKKVTAAQERKESERRFGFAYPGALRLAGALCAFVFVFFFGFMVARQGISDPTVEQGPGRSVVEIDTVCVPNPDVNMASFLSGDIEGTEWLIVECDVDSVGFSELTQEDIASGVAYRCRIELTAHNVQGRSQNFSLGTISSEISADICFYSSEELYWFVDCMSDSMLIRLIMNNDESWIATEFSAAE